MTEVLDRVQESSSEAEESTALCENSVWNRRWLLWWKKEPECLCPAAWRVSWACTRGHGLTELLCHTHACEDPNLGCGACSGKTWSMSQLRIVSQTRI